MEATECQFLILEQLDQILLEIITEEVHKALIETATIILTEDQLVHLEVQQTEELKINNSLQVNQLADLQGQHEIAEVIHEAAVLNQLADQVVANHRQVTRHRVLQKVVVHHLVHHHQALQAEDHHLEGHHVN